MKLNFLGPVKQNPVLIIERSFLTGPDREKVKTAQLALHSLLQICIREQQLRANFVNKYYFSFSQLIFLQDFK